MHPKLIISKFNPQAWWSALTDFRRAVHLVIAMFEGGLVICSTRKDNRETKIYAETLIQLDGDIITAFTPEAIQSPDFAQRFKQHMKQVDHALKPLSGLAVGIAGFKGMMFIIGTLGSIVSIYNSIIMESYVCIIGFLGSLLAFTGCALTRKIFVVIIESRVKRLTKTAMQKFESGYGRNLATG